MRAIRLPLRRRTRCRRRAARSRLRSSLPTEVSGIASTMWTSRGYLFAASRSWVKAISSSGGHRGAVGERHERDHLLAERGRPAGRPPPAIATAGCSQQHVLDVARVDVVAAPDDQVLHPVDDGEVSVGVEAADVAGVEPAVRRRLAAPVATSSRSGRAPRSRRPAPAGSVVAVEVLTMRRSRRSGTALPTVPGAGRQRRRTRTGCPRSRCTRTPP